ncbi:COMM domain-containing protein 5-like [Corticium candelabrum]|uniref:COMM domain-containing protein 5-like n=1 Tax=Corticium candelabrum TaxID=121492 RepID=UPI002E26AC0D|nr:COMM domain-containing protein 5-like [Corticium candelabrum]
MSAVQVMAMSGAAASDRTPFFGARMPIEMKSMLPHLKSVDKGLFRKLLQAAVRALENEGIGEDEFAALTSDHPSPEVIRTVYTGLLVLLQAALRLPQSSLKSDMFKADLKEIKGIPQEFISDLVKAVFGPRRQHLNEAVIQHRVRLPTLQSFRWRVNVSISTSALNRVLEPSVLVEMTLSSGKIKTFEVPVSKFHELRYNVAYVLKQMEDLEKRSILKVQD